MLKKSNGDFNWKVIGPTIAGLLLASVTTIFTLTWQGTAGDVEDLKQTKVDKGEYDVTIDYIQDDIDAVQDDIRVIRAEQRKANDILVRIEGKLDAR